MSGKVGFVETPLPIAELMVSLIEAPKDVRVLDSGCGRGVFIEALLKAGFKNVRGIEIDPQLYAECSGKYGDRAEILKGDFLKHRDTYDVIIGNPPYVHFNSLPPHLSEEVSRIIRSREGDIYYAFILKALELLREGGQLVYIVPYHFFYNTYARVVREALLRKGSLEVVIDLDEVRIFSKSPETVIFRFVKGRKGERMKILRIKDRKATPKEIRDLALDALKNRRSNRLFHYSEAPQFRTAGPWSSFVAGIPEFEGIPLKKLAKVGVGLVSGFDEAFRVSQEELSGFSDEERKLVKRFVKARNCDRFVVRGHALYIVMDDRIRDEGQLREMYPNIYARLLPYRERMTKRYLPAGKRWFHYQALRNYTFLLSHISEPKIYVPTLDRRPYNRFSLSYGPDLPSGDVLFIYPYRREDLLFLLGYLNTRFFREYYLGRGGRRGGRVSFTQRLLERAEVPVFSKEVKERISALSGEIVSRRMEGEDTTALEEELERTVREAVEGVRQTVSLF